MKTSDDDADGIPVSAGPGGDGVPSPCRRNCCLDEDDVCMGCGRSLGEILRWGEASNAERREILRSAELRRRRENADAPRPRGEG